jgi:2-oxoglutarate ferredoxin oxidoreductase subunit gamma
MSESYNIIISGEGGQGVLSIAKIIAKTAWQQGKKSVYVPYFSTEKRGGISMAFAQVSDEVIPFPKFRKAHLWVALSQRAVDRMEPYLQEGTTVIVNSHLVKDLSKIEAWQPHVINATDIAKNELKKPRTFNMIIMGAMLNFVPGLSKEGFEASLDKQFADKYVRDPELKELNKRAFDMGYDLIKSAQ